MMIESLRVTADGKTRKRKTRVKKDYSKPPKKQPRWFTTPEAEDAFTFKPEEHSIPGAMHVEASKPTKCSHCGKEAPNEIFGEDGRWLHRGCTSRGPIKEASITITAGDVIDLGAEFRPGDEYFVRGQEASRALIAREGWVFHVLSVLKDGNVHIRFEPRPPLLNVRRQMKIPIETLRGLVQSGEIINERAIAEENDRLDREEIERSMREVQETQDLYKDHNVFQDADPDPLAYTHDEDLPPNVIRFPGPKKRGSITIRAAGLVLRRKGFQNYEGEYNGHRIKVRREEVVAKGSYPANQRQKREPRWFLEVDGMKLGDARTFAEARQMAHDACAKLPDETVAEKTAATITVEDGTGASDKRMRLDEVKTSDKARVTAPVENGGGRGRKRVSVTPGAVGKVESVDPHAPSITISVLSDASDGTQERSVTVPAEALSVLISADDPRA